MLAPYLPASGRHLLFGPSARNQLCPCHAKRYVPKPKQRKGVADGPTRQGGLRRRPSTAERSHGGADAEELLRELNSGGGGLLRDEEEVDWGLDDIAEHARARAQQEQARWGAAEAPTGSATRTAGGARLRGRLRGTTDLHTHGSLMETGLANVREGGEADAGAAPTAALAAAPCSNGVASASDRAGVPAVRHGSRVMELEASYARRNPEVVEALRHQGVAVRVRQPDAQYDHDNDGEAEGDGNRAREAGWHRDDLGYEDEEDDLGLSLTMNLAVDEDPRAGGRGSGSDRKTAGTPANNDWYGSLAASGFSIRTNEAGEVFLERTVRRKAAATAAAAAAGSSSSTTRGTGVPAGAAATAGTGDAAGGAASAAHARTRATAAAASASGQAFNGGAAKSAGKSALTAAPALAPEPFAGTPAMATALERLRTAQQVLDVLELSYPQWAANGYRLVDVRSGRPVPAPSPAEAAHCLRALALTALREDIGGWRCLDLAAGRQSQGLAECLRVIPPRLLPEIATQQLSAAYFEAARQYWLDSAVQPVIEDPRATTAKQIRLAATKAAAAPERSMGRAPRYGTGDGGSGAAGAAADFDDEVLLEVRSGPLNDPMYDTLLTKYDTLSRHRQLLNAVQDARRQQPALNGRTTTETKAAAAATAVAAGAATAGDQQGTPSAPPRASGAAVVAEATAEARVGGVGEARVPAATTSSAASAAFDVSEMRAAKVECLVAALWGMSSLGSTPYFMSETEAALSILVRCLATFPGAEARAGTSPGGPSSSATGPPALSSGREASACRPTGLSGWQAGQVLWALGNSRHGTPRLRDLEAAMLRTGGLAAMPPRDVSRVLWGFASLGHRPERLLLTIRPDWERQSPRAGARKGAGGGGGGKAAGGRTSDVRSFSPQQLAGVVWALAVMQQVDTLPFRSAWGELLRRAKEVPPAEPILTQIWQANLALHLESSAASSSSAAAAGTPFSATTAAAGAAATAAALPYNRRGGSASAAKDVDLTAAGLAAAAAAATASRGGTSATAAGAEFDQEAARGLLLRARDVFLAATSGLRRRVQSGYQRQMANTLTGLRVMHLVEDNSAGYSIDITLPQLRIAIEADGPTHTSRTPGGAVLGATLMKRRHLQLLGWHVINVPYKEWDKLSSEASRRAFLQERIDAALLGRINLQDEGFLGPG